jgi:hypothetical protein
MGAIMKPADEPDRLLGAPLRITAFTAGFGLVSLPHIPGGPDTWITVYLSRIFRQIKAAGQSEGEGR